VVTLIVSKARSLKELVAPHEQPLLLNTVSLTLPLTVPLTLPLPLLLALPLPLTLTLTLPLTQVIGDVAAPISRRVRALLAKVYPYPYP